MGLALTDELGIISSPYGVLPNDGELYTRIADVVGEKNVERIVVGLPITLSGDEGETATSARAFAETLSERIDVPVELFDERLTTKAAERAMRESGAGGLEIKEKADAVAAALLLETYLKYVRNQDDTPATDE